MPHLTLLHAFIVIALIQTNSYLVFLEGTRRESLGPGPLSWYYILIICIGSLMILIIIVVILICLINKKSRQANNKQSHVDYEVKKSSSSIESDPKELDSKPNQYYLNQDASSLISNSLNERNALPNSNLSNNTSCSSVNTVDNQPHGYMTPSHLEQPNLHHRFNNPHQTHTQHNMGTPNMTPNSNEGSNPSMVKELNVTTLLPNSWDAKELLDHWGRVQEAKQRQESPPVMRMQTASPSIPSFGGSSLDNYNQSYQFQPATVQPSMSGHYPHEMQEQTDYHQPPIYSPYSNASSIWQHHHQQHQPQRPYHHGQMAHHIATAYTPTPIGYDDNGLPEYSVVRKVHPNISQV